MVGGGLFPAALLYHSAAPGRNLFLGALTTTDTAAPC
jgi:hypothetical protein